MFVALIYWATWKEKSCDSEKIVDLPRGTLRQNVQICFSLFVTSAYFSGLFFVFHTFTNNSGKVIQKINIQEPNLIKWGFYVIYDNICIIF